MGAVSTNKKKIFLKQEEIDEVIKANHSLGILYEKFKDANGNLSERDFEKIIENRIDQKIAQKIFKILSSFDNKFNLENLKIFYSIFKSDNPETKIIFITETIFRRKNFILQEKYLQRINFYYGKSKELFDFLNDKQFIASLLSNNRILKDQFIKLCLKNSRKFFENFRFMRDNYKNLVMSFNNNLANKNQNNLKKNFEKGIDLEKYENLQNNKLDENEKELLLLNYSNNCNCLEIFMKKLNVNKVGKYTSKEDEEFMNKYFEKEFEFYEKINEGIFKLSLLESMFDSIGINKYLNFLIISYIKKLCQKVFIDFKTFKSLLLKFCTTQDLLNSVLFEIITYPKDYISINEFIKLAKQFDIVKSDTNNIRNILENHQIKDEKILLENFILIMKEIGTSILESIEKIKYVPYLFFNKKTDDVNLQKNCIEILFQSKKVENLKDLNKYVHECVPEEITFYIVDFEFWKNWLDYIEINKSETISTNFNFVYEKENSSNGNGKISSDKQSQTMHREDEKSINNFELHKKKKIGLL